MIHLFLNGSGASAGGGLTYLRNVVPHLSAHGDVHTTVVANLAVQRELESLPRISFVEFDIAASAATRFWQEQRRLPELIRQSGAQALISAGNFALRNSPVPQILLSRNSLYTSSDFSRDLLSRRDYALWADTKIKAMLAKRSIAWANCTVAPSRAFATELNAWTGREIVTIYHGFDHDAFVRDPQPLPAEIQQKLYRTDDSLRLLFVSHYNYYRNFETLLRALPILQRKLNRSVQLFLTCKLRTEENPGSYKTDNAAALVRELGIAGNVVELGTIPYELLHQVYQACDLYVTPAYAESFAHPLLEAMASALPVVASDLPVHREICGDAALFFDRFSPEKLADAIVHAISGNLLAQMTVSGRARSQAFSWKRHVDELLQLAGSLIV